MHCRLLQLPTFLTSHYVVLFVRCWKAKTETAHALTGSGLRNTREDACGFACGNASCSESCTNRGFKDGRAPLSQEWHCGGRQGWSADRQRECARLGVWPTGCLPGPAPYGGQRTLEQSEFYVADVAAILSGDPAVALYVAAILARRLDAANRWLVAVKRQLQSGEPHRSQAIATRKLGEPATRPDRDGCLHTVTVSESVRARPERRRSPPTQCITRCNIDVSSGVSRHTHILTHLPMRAPARLQCNGSTSAAVTRSVKRPASAAGAAERVRRR
jgi:hypothetical protein